MSVRSLIAKTAILCAGAFSQAYAQSAPRVERLPGNPIIVPTMLPGTDGDNINGPSLIRVPPWVEGRLGEYYLYFANHAGTYIRMAHANDVAGPWTVYGPGTLHMESTVCNDALPSFRHIASPDVHVDTVARQIRMYFHCPLYMSGPRGNMASYKQLTLVATSKDGLAFNARSEPLGNSYFRVFKWMDEYYALGMPGVFYRSIDGMTGFKEGPTLFTRDMRHSAIVVRNGKLTVLYTNAGDNPERILLSEVTLDPDWMKWRASEPIPVLQPELDWEGANLPHVPSERGEVRDRVRQLRDPALFVMNGHTYLLYSVAGESGLAIAELFWN